MRTYEQFIKEFNLGSNQGKCMVCGADAWLFASPIGRDIIRQFCEKEKISRIWRKVEIDMTKAHCTRFIREHKLLTTQVVCERLGISQSYLRDRVGRKKIPFVEMGHRIFFAEADLPSIAIYFKLISRKRKLSPEKEKLLRKKGEQNGKGNAVSSD